jgi:ribosomal protein S18 acetylase RimI-like enzyme
MDINFRPAKRSDIDSIVLFVRELYEQDHIRFDDSIARAALEKIIGNTDLGRVWLVCDGDQAVGYIVLGFGYSLEFHGRDAMLDEIYIRASHRGQGVGKQAIKLVEDTCRSLGIHALHLEVERSNTSAQAFYRKVGFEDHDRYLMTRWLVER